MPTQSSFEFQESQRYLKQPSSELLFGDTGIRTVSHERRHERTHILVLLPASLSLFTDQMKTRSFTGYGLSKPAVSALQGVPSGATLLDSGCR
jgi:hypothetical protein